MVDLNEKFIVIKKEDIDKYLNDKGKTALYGCLEIIEDSRELNCKKLNNYLVVNKDEPYADLVSKLILNKITIQDIIETIARNCTAWDTSKDKKEGLLPEVSATNEYLYKILTGEKYNFYSACRKFNIK